MAYWLLLGLLGLLLLAGLALGLLALVACYRALMRPGLGQPPRSPSPRG